MVVQLLWAGIVCAAVVGPGLGLFVLHSLLQLQALPANAQTAR